MRKTYRKFHIDVLHRHARLATIDFQLKTRLKRKTPSENFRKPQTVRQKKLMVENVNGLCPKSKKDRNLRFGRITWHPLTGNRNLCSVIQMSFFRFPFVRKSQSLTVFSYARTREGVSRSEFISVLTIIIFDTLNRNHWFITTVRSNLCKIQNCWLCCCVIAKMI